MHFLYIIYSEKLDHYYVGETADLENRLQYHNRHLYKKAFTKGAEDWKMVLAKELTNKEDALYLERFIKKMKSKKFIEKVINDHSILDDILRKK